MSDTHNIELWKNQILLVNTYKTIDLKQWRFILVDNKPEWLYVGDWSPGPIKPYPSKRDGGYSQRQRNLESNRYFYWPRGEEEEESLKRDREEREAQLWKADERETGKEGESYSGEERGAANQDECILEELLPGPRQEAGRVREV